MRVTHTVTQALCCCILPRPSLQVDESYLSKTRKRLAAASQKEAKKRAVITLEDEREMTKLAGGSESAPLYVKNRQVRVLLGWGLKTGGRGASTAAVAGCGDAIGAAWSDV